MVNWEFRHIDGNLNPTDKHPSWKPFKENSNIENMDISKDNSPRFIRAKMSKNYLIEIMKSNIDDFEIECSLFIPMKNDSKVKQINNELMQKFEEDEKKELFNSETKFSLTLNLVILE